MREKERRADLAFVLFCLVVAGITWREAARLPDSPFDPLGPGSVPMGLCVALAVLALLLAGRLLLGLDGGTAKQSLLVGAPDENGGELPYRLRPGLAVLAALLTLAYVAALQLRLLGFVWVTLVYLAVLGAVMLPRRAGPQAISLAIAVIGAFALEFIFTRLVVIDLP